MHGGAFNVLCVDHIMQTCTSMPSDKLKDPQARFQDVQLAEIQNFGVVGLRNTDSDAVM